MPLVSFAGCFDKQLGVEYEDCHFVIGGISQGLLQWFNATLTATGPDVRRDLTVYQVTGLDQSAPYISRTDIGNAFISDFRISDLDALVNSAGTVSITVVPDSIQTQSDGGFIAVSHTAFERNTFKVEIFSPLVGFDFADSGIAALRGLHMSAPKEQLGTGGPGDATRILFSPGTPQFDDIRLEVAVSSAGAATAADLNLWIDQMDNDPEADNTRDANVTLKKPNGQVAAIVRLFDLLPLTALEPYSSASGRGITLDLGHFDFQQP